MCVFVQHLSIYLEDAKLDGVGGKLDGVIDMGDTFNAFCSA